MPAFDDCLRRLNVNNKLNLAYPIRGEEVAIVSVFIDNIQYGFTKPWAIDLESRSKQVAAGTYTRRESINLGEGKIEISQFDTDSRIKRMKSSAGITEMVFDLDELVNSNNLSNRSPCNTSLMHHVTSYEDFMHFESYIPQYKKLKNGKIVCLTLRIKDMKDNIVTDGPYTIIYFILQNGVRK